VVIAVPDRWAGITEQAIAVMDSQNGRWQWQFEVDEDPGSRLSWGDVNLALVPDDSGFAAGERILALGVPFTSEWEEVTLDQAQKMIVEDSPFVAVVDWADMTPQLKSLAIDGVHPGEPDYPLQQTWSVIAAPGYESAAEEIAPLIGNQLGIDPVTHLAAVGDLMMARRIGERIENGDPIYPFELVFDELSAADITVGNLECALGEQGAPVDKGYTFHAPPGAARSFAIAGFDLLSLANNHAMDYGPDALLEAISLLQTNHVQTVGAGENADAASAPVIITVNQTSVAFLAYVDVPVEVRGFDARSWTATQNQPGLTWADLEQMEADITSLRPLVDIVVVMLHSGYEYVVQPSTPQVRDAHTAVDAGADLVLGHHAHVLQGIEFYNQGVIVYGLGNFVFDDGDIPQTALLNVWLDSDGVRELELVPIMITEDGRPRLATDSEADDILALVYSKTKEVVSP
jgi:poly-gamma-glutamate capsule biosynthesis protein CapA/YwtB (metallophosphatase superfamily)